VQRKLHLAEGGAAVRVQELAVLVRLSLLVHCNV
jgi:hypothetical protein